MKGGVQVSKTWSLVPKCQRRRHGPAGPQRGVCEGRSALTQGGLSRAQRKKRGLQSWVSDLLLVGAVWLVR